MLHSYLLDVDSIWKNPKTSKKSEAHFYFPLTADLIPTSLLFHLLLHRQVLRAFVRPSETKNRCRRFQKSLIRIFLQVPRSF